MVRGSGGSHRTTNYDQPANDKSHPAYRSRKHYQPQTKCSSLGNATARQGTCSKPRRLHEQLPLPVAAFLVGIVDMAGAAAEIDDRQAVAEKLGVAGEPDQPRGLSRIGMSLATVRRNAL